jgi:hypothetical protein
MSKPTSTPADETRIYYCQFKQRLGDEMTRSVPSGVRTRHRLHLIEGNQLEPCPQKLRKKLEVYFGYLASIEKSYNLCLFIITISEIVALFQTMLHLLLMQFDHIESSHSLYCFRTRNECMHFMQRNVSLWNSSTATAMKG